ncbi:hypothetical protein [Blautia massiliensis (ex Durand et al. 2017)]|uniref:hypothetical protein n=1 Tax=Blautia massiliensis (ex Durand et al. 2017) TaxID=1737424 RepID=UPI003568F088
MRRKKIKEPLRIAMFGHKRIPSREGGVEIVVEEHLIAKAPNKGLALCAVLPSVILYQRWSKNI